MSGEVERVHATAIAVGDRAALIRGSSGSGKSDLALRCLGLGPSALVRGAVKLVSDDQVVLKHEGSCLRASAPPQLRGKLEIRGLGILEVDGVTEANVVYLMGLVTPAEGDAAAEIARTTQGVSRVVKVFEYMS